MMIVSLFIFQVVPRTYIVSALVRSLSAMFGEIIWSLRHAHEDSLMRTGKGLRFFVEFVGLCQCGSSCDHVVDVHFV